MLAAAMGWIGTLGTIGAYVMLSRGYVSPTSIRYGVLNLVGGMLGATGSAAYGAWPSVASNLVWSGVALQSVLMTLRARRPLHVVAVEAPSEEPDEQSTDPWPDTLTMPAVLSAA